MLDHDHNNGLFRNFLCHTCNCRTDTNYQKIILQGYPKIYWENIKRWVIVNFKYKNLIVYKYFKSKYEAIIYRWLLKELHDI
jgi:hypothetical protein